jgi:mRNA interferase RelE/StbE
MNVLKGRLSGFRLMTYELAFHEKALSEWKSLDKSIQERFKKVLEKRLENPHVPSAKLRGSPNRYKIKIRRPGFRLVYAVDDGDLVIEVIVIGKREDGAVYTAAAKR